MEDLDPLLKQQVAETVGEEEEFSNNLEKLLEQVSESYKTFQKQLDLQNELLLDKGPGILRKNIGLIRSRLLLMCDKLTDRPEALDCKHCLIWLQAMNVAYENKKHYASIDKVDMLTYLNQFCQHVLAILNDDSIDPPELKLENIDLDIGRAISCGILQFELFMGLRELGAENISCELTREDNRYRYCLHCEALDLPDELIEKFANDETLQTVVEDGLQGEIEYNPPGLCQLQVSFPA